MKVCYGLEALCGAHRSANRREGVGGEWDVGCQSSRVSKHNREKKSHAFCSSVTVLITCGILSYLIYCEHTVGAIKQSQHFPHPSDYGAGVTEASFQMLFTALL